MGIALLAILSRISLLTHFTTHFIGGARQDSGLYLWLVETNARDLFSQPWFNTYAFYPYSSSLAWSDNFILPSLLIKLLLLTGIPLIPAYNAIFLLAFVLSGFCTWRLCYRLSANGAVAFLAGILFMNCSYLLGMLGHPQLQFVFFIPMALGFLCDHLATRRVLSAVLLGLTISCAFLTTVYYAVFITLMIAVFICGLLLFNPRLLSWCSPLKLMCGTALGMLPLIPCLPPYFAVKDVFGERALYEPFFFSATALSYLSAPALNLLYKWSSVFSHEEAHLFCGLLPLVLLAAAIRSILAAGTAPLRRFFALSFAATCIGSCFVLSSALAGYATAAASWCTLIAFGLILKRMGEKERGSGFSHLTARGFIAVTLFCFLVFFLISLGPLGNPAEGQAALGIFRVPYALFPGLDAVRAISRAGAVALFFVAVSGSLFLALINERQRLLPITLVAMLFAVVVENIHTEIPLEPDRLHPLIFDQLNALPIKSEALIVLPMTASLDPNGQVKSWGNFAEYNVDYMRWSLFLQRPIINGYSGQRSKLMKELPRALDEFPNERSLQTLQTIAGLRYIIYISSNKPDFKADEFQERARRLSDRITLVSSDQEGNYLFDLSPERTLSADSSLLVPSYPEGTLHLDLRYEGQFEGPAAAVEILDPDHFGQSPVSVISLEQTSAWQTFTLPLPRTTERVRPLKLVLKPKGPQKIILGKSHFQGL